MTKKQRLGSSITSGASSVKYVTGFPRIPLISYHAGKAQEINTFFFMTADIESVWPLLELAVSLREIIYEGEYMFEVEHSYILCM